MRSLLGRGVRGATSRLRAWLPHRPKPAILMYHRIADEPFDPWALAVKPAHFAEQLSWLSRNRTLLRLQDFARLHREGALPRDAISLTMDDGYSCNAKVAAPLLEQFKIPATIFLPAELIERGRPFWWDELEEIVLEHSGPSLSVDGEEVPIGARHSEDRRWTPGSRPRTPRQLAFQQIHARLVTKRAADVESLMEDLRRQTKQENRPTKRPMTAEEIRRIASPIVEFGSHALTHPWLPSLGSAEQAREIGGSVDRCRALSGQRPTALAYPFGAFDEQSERLAEEAGFECACSTQEAAVTASGRPFSLPRVQVGDWTAAKLARRLAAL